MEKEVTAVKYTNTDNGSNTFMQDSFMFTNIWSMEAHNDSKSVG